MTNKALAKDIRQSLNHQPAYLDNIEGRKRVYDAVCNKTGALHVKVYAYGDPLWLEVGPTDSVTIYAGTVMEETFGFTNL